MASRMIQNNFSGGEISPVLHGRSDLQAYYKGCAKAENFIVTKEGTLRKRNGLIAKLNLTKENSGDNASTCFKTIPYRFDRENGSIFVLANQPNRSSPRIRGILYGKNFTQLASHGFAGGTFEDKDVLNMRFTQIGDQLWLTNGKLFKIVTITENTDFSVSDWAPVAEPNPVRSFKCTGYDASGNPYSGSTETEIFYAAYIVQDGAMSKPVKSSAYQKKSWVAGAYVECVLGLSAEQVASMDYCIIAKSNGGDTSYGEVARFYAEDFAAGETSITFTDKNVSPGAAVYSQTNVLGKSFKNPLCVDCFQQRRVFANAETDGAKYPMTLWFSEVGNLVNFFANRPTTDADAFSPTIASTGPSFIRWVIAYQEMLILFTDGGIFSVGFSQSAGFSASSCRITRVSGIVASDKVQPVACDAGVVFVGGDCKTVYTAAYDLQENMLKPVNRSVLVEHMTRYSRITSLAVQEYPDQIAWFVLEDGSALAFTFERNQEVFAWTRSKLPEGFSFVEVQTLGTCTDSNTERTMSDMIFQIRSPSGDVHLAKFRAGRFDEIDGTEYPIKATLTTLRAESQERTISGKRKNVKDILIRLYETGGIAVKPANGGEAVELVPVRTGTNSLFTGDVKVMPRGFVDETGQMTFVSDNKKRCEILQIVTDMEVME